MMISREKNENESFLECEPYESLEIQLFKQLSVARDEFMEGSAAARQCG